MKIFYKDNKYTGHTESPYDVKIEGGGIIEVAKDSIEADNIRSGKIPTISNGKITGWTEPDKTDADLAFEDIDKATTATDQKSKFIKYLMIKEGIEPK